MKTLKAVTMATVLLAITLLDEVLGYLLLVAWLLVGRPLTVAYLWISHKLL